MGWLPVILAVIAAILFYIAKNTIWLAISVIAAIGSFWSWGIMHNYAINAAKYRPDFTGKFYDINPSEASSVPNWISTVNLIFSILSLITLIVAIVKKYF